MRLNLPAGSSIYGDPAYLDEEYEKKVGTSISSISKLLPKSIHAVTAKGFELKVVGFLVVFAATFLQY